MEKRLHAGGLETGSGVVMEPQEEDTCCYHLIQSQGKDDGWTKVGKLSEVAVKKFKMSGFLLSPGWIWL